MPILATRTLPWLLTPAPVLALVLALVLAGAACTPAPTPAPDAGPEVEPYVAASSYCEEIATFFCPFYLRCGRLAASDLDECLAIFAESCESKFEPGYVALEQAGLMRLSRAGLDACAAHLDEVVCDLHPRDLDGPCAAIWEGQQGPGEACGFNLESFVCAPGTQCSLGLDLCGECRPVVDVGEPCGAEVEPPVTCGGAAECQDGRCVARVPLLNACGEGDRCVLGASCIEGVCRGPDYVPLGQACDAQNRCPFNAHCEGTCVQDALQGEACLITECASGVCGPDNVCAAPGGVGDPCESSLDCETLLCVGGSCANPPSACIP